MTIKMEQEIKKLAQRDINTLKIGKIELQNNHNHLYCFYKGYLVYEWENIPDEFGRKCMIRIHGITLGKSEETRVTNIFNRLIALTKQELN